jgi:plastocyanin
VSSGAAGVSLYETDKDDERDRMIEGRRIRSAFALLGALFLLAFAFAACGDDDDDTTDGGAAVTGGEATTPDAGPDANPPPKPGGAAPRAETVEMVDFAFERPAVTVQAGGKVTWKNQGEAPHTATADDGSFDTGTVEPGKLQAETFKETGTFSYICEIHPEMKGTVEVVSG